MPGRISLSTRLLLLVALGLGATLATFGILGFMAVRQAEDEALDTRLKMARALAAQIDYLLVRELQALQEAAYVRQIDPTDGDPEPEQAALREAYLRTTFNGGLYVLDREGQPHWTEPPSLAMSQDFLALPHVQSTLQTGRIAVSDAYRDPLGRLLISVAVPLKDRAGNPAGLLGGDIEIISWPLQRALASLALEPTDDLELVDSHGLVIASTRPAALFTTSDHAGQLADLIAAGESRAGTCHACHRKPADAGPEQIEEKQVMAFAPLTMAPWGVLLREPEETALAASRTLRTRLIIGGGLLAVVSLLTVWVTAQSIVRPLRQLTEAADTMAAGDLQHPVRLGGRDEIGRLGRAFETMRRRLKGALEDMEHLNAELERRVRRRTRQLEVSHARLQEATAVTQRLYRDLQHKEALRSQLLRQVISAQEDERKRIARELHDEMSQALSLLILKVQEARAGPAAAQEPLTSVETLARGLLDGVHRIIFDLRPSLLDDLGLVAAIRWLVRTRLDPTETAGLMEISGRERRLAPEIETTVFRVIQEAITNVVRHAHASQALVQIQFADDRLRVDITDDGVGFVPEELDKEIAPGLRRGFGLMGMRERIALLDGVFQVRSAPGRGTHLHLEVPIGSKAESAP